jgi:uncharacterized protein YdeI (YjbR/CyaY-like superfamily)
MGKRDPRVDSYIEKAADFAKPILVHIRNLVHEVCPEVEETMKWSFPCFDYKGTFCSMASFKQHCSFGFWKATLMKDAELLKENQGEGMGHLGRITSMKDLPSDKQLKAYIKEAKKLNDDGVKLPPKKKTTSTDIVVPAFFTKELKKNPAAHTAFQNFSPSHRKEYVQWVTEAKTEETRNKRMATTLEWLTEGKSRNWKYERKK